MGEAVPWLQDARKAQEERSAGMTRVGVLRIEKISEKIPMPSDTAALSRVLEAKSASLRAQRAFCYSLLERLYADTFCEKMPELSFSPEGKPSFKKSAFFISLSHSEELCAVAIAEREVGIDVQSFWSIRGKERTVSRFVNDSLQNKLKNTKTAEVEFAFYGLNKGGEIEKEESPDAFARQENNGAVNESAALWTKLEALIKCRRGFVDIKEAPSLASFAEIKTVYLKDAAISVATI